MMRQRKNIYHIVLNLRLDVIELHLLFFAMAYAQEEVGEGDVRTVLKLHPYLAPFKAAVLPLSKKLSPKAQEVHDMLLKNLCVIMMKQEV